MKENSADPKEEMKDAQKDKKEKSTKAKKVPSDKQLDAINDANSDLSKLSKKPST